MKNQKPQNKTNVINIPGFGPIRIPAHNYEQHTPETQIKNKASKLDTICSIKAVINKLLKNK